MILLACRFPKYSRSVFPVSLVMLCALLSGAVSGGEQDSSVPSGARVTRVYEARVTRVFDGDTLWVKPLAGGRYRKLRLDGLDAPEICQSGGIASRDALAARVLSQVVTVRERHHDDYGRALVHLDHAGEDVGSLLVSHGHAWSYRWRNSLGAYQAQEAMARKESRGIFSDPAVELPRDFRRRHGPCPRP